MLHSEVTHDTGGILTVPLGGGGGMTMRTQDQSQVSVAREVFLSSQDLNICILQFQSVPDTIVL
jgi:hypothetical protein